MGTRFILGRAGSGKTHFLREALVRHLSPDPLAASAIVIVPKQSTFGVEQSIARDARLGGFVDVRVIAPDDLGELALVETGAAAGARLDQVGRGLILTHLLRTHADKLVHFGRSATQPGLAGEIDATFAEFERAGRDLCDIDDLIDQSRESPDTVQQALSRKLTDLCLLYKSYQQYLKAHGFDSFNRQTRAVEAIESCRLFQRSLVLIDDFYEFTAYERQLIAALAKTAPQTLIAMMVNPASPIARNIHHIPGETEILAKPEMTYRKLYFDLQKAEVTIEPPVLLTDHPRYASEALSAIERGQFDLDPRTAPAGDAVRRIVASDRADEVDAAAREIIAMLARGYRLRDICVLARSIEEYESLIESSFTEHGLAFFTDKRRPAAHHPLVRAMTAIGMLVQTRWSHESVIELIRSGLVDIAPSHADLLDDYIRQHNIPPSEWLKDEPWQFHRSIDDEEQSYTQFTTDEIDTVNDTRRRIRQALAHVGSPDWISGEATVRDRTADVFAALDALGVRPSLLNVINAAERDGDIQLRDEHLQVWARVAEIADQIAGLLGDVVTTGAGFAQLLQQTLAELDLAITPPTIDQVLVGSIERTRTHNPRAVILLGMNAGQFPRTLSEQPVLNDRDRQALNDSGVEVRPSSRQAMLEERFLGYLALTRSCGELVLIRTASDASGNPLEPSPFWTSVERCVTGIADIRPTTTIERIATPRQAITHALVWAREPLPQTQSDETASLYQWLAGDATERVRIVRDRAWPALRYDNRAALSPGVAKRLFTTKLEASVSRFESFAACPFQHFARYGLRLQQPPEPDITALDLGILYHSVLERLVKRAIEEHIDFATTDELTPEQIRDIAQLVGEQLRNQVFMSTAQNRYTLERLEQVVYRLIRAQQFVASRGVFRPGFAELVFGKRGTLPALQLKTPGGNEVHLSGKIDRVDIDLQKSRYTVIDYKLGGEQLSLGYVAHGLMLQLLTYLLVIQANDQKLAGQRLTPAAALYVRMLRSIDSTTDPAAEPAPETPEFHTKSKPRGLINALSADDLDTDFASTGQSAAFAMRRKKDGTFYESGCDAVEAEQFESLVAFVHDKIITLADQIVAGEIGVEPYLIGTASPCPTCVFKHVCRFDRLINRYRVLPSLSHKEALQLITDPGAAS
jgi:ATP-dependent helicase/nuclease subunit B